MKLLVRIVTAAAVAAGLYVLLRHVLDESDLDQTEKNEARPQQSPQPQRRPTDGLTRKELYERAQSLGIEGRSKMNKDELAQAVREAGGGPA